MRRQTPPGSCREWLSSLAPPVWQVTLWSVDLKPNINVVVGSVRLLRCLHFPHHPNDTSALIFDVVLQQISFHADDAPAAATRGLSARFCLNCTKHKVIPPRNHYFDPEDSPGPSSCSCQLFSFIFWSYETFSSVFEGPINDLSLGWSS